MLHQGDKNYLSFFRKVKFLGAKSPDRGPSESLPSCGLSFLENSSSTTESGRNEPTATFGSSISSTTASNLFLEEEEEDENGPLKPSLVASVCDNIFFCKLGSESPYFLRAAQCLNTDVLSIGRDL